MLSPQRGTERALLLTPRRLRFRGAVEQIEILDARAGIEQHDSLARMDLAALEKLTQGQYACSPLGCGEDSFSPGQLSRASQQFIVSDRDCHSVGLANRVQDQEIADRL